MVAGQALHCENPDVGLKWLTAHARHPLLPSGSSPGPHSATEKMINCGDKKNPAHPQKSNSESKDLKMQNV